MTRKKRALILAGVAVFFGLAILVSTEQVFPVFRRLCGLPILLALILYFLIHASRGVADADSGYYDWQEYWRRRGPDDRD